MVTRKRLPRLLHICPSLFGEAGAYDAIIRAYRRALGVGAAGRQRVMQKFTWPTVARRCLEIYGVDRVNS